MTTQTPLDNPTGRACGFPLVPVFKRDYSSARIIWDNFPGLPSEPSWAKQRPQSSVVCQGLYAAPLSIGLPFELSRQVEDESHISLRHAFV